jgi:WD40 repeat protein
MAKETQYDVFLSHNSQDKPAVERMAQSLRNRGLEPFLDRWYLRPGLPWPQKLEEALRTCRAVAVFLGPYGLGGWQAREMYLALERQKQEPHFPVIPVLLPDADPALSFLTLNTWVDLRGGIDDPVGLEILTKAIRGEPPGPELQERITAALETVCPYRGLRAFREEDAPFFFGRGAFADQLAELVRQRSLVAVVGPSGSGKSSLVFAGLVPWLRRARPPKTVWDVASFTPDDRPYHRLAAALLPLLEPEMTEAERLIEVGKLAPALAEDTVRLRDVAERILEKQPGTDRLLLVADQFEELYTLTLDESVRRGFVDHLLEVTEHSPIQVVLTLRGDFYGRALSHRPFADALQDKVINLGPMTQEELEQAVVGPAGKVGLKFEPGLVERILEDVGDEPGNLPLLEFALTELWNRRWGTTLTHQAYEAIGRVHGAIARRAEAEYGRLGDEEKRLARRIFLRLVAPGEGTEDTRRRAALAELLPTEGEAMDIKTVVWELAGARLLTTGRDERGKEIVNVVHEALIRGWPRLREWIEEDRAGLRTHRRLTETANEWEENNHDESYLHRGTRLAEAEEWAKAHADDMNPLEREFLEASVALRNREAQDAERRRQRELEQTRRLAEERRKRVLWLSGALVLTVIAAIAAVWFGGQAARNAITARRERSVALARQLAAQAVSSLEVNRDAELSLLLATEGAQRVHTASEKQRVYSAGKNQALEIDNALRLTLQVAPQVILRHDGAVDAAVFSPDGQRLATASDDGTARIWDTKSGMELAVLHHEGKVKAVAFSPDGAYLATASWGNDTARLWDVESGTEQAVLRHEDEVNAVAFSPDGAYLATTSGDGTARLWDVESGTEQAVLRHEDEVNAVAFSPDGAYLATTSRDGTARLWDVENGTEQDVLHHDKVRVVVFSPDGRQLATAGRGGPVRLWDVETGSELFVWHHEADGITDLILGGIRLAFSPDGQRLAASGGEGRLWDTQSGIELAVQWPGSMPVLDIAFSVDGRQMAFADFDGAARLWDVESGTELAALRHGGLLRAVVFSPNGRWVTTVGEDGTARLWNVEIGVEPTVLRHGDSVNNVAFSSDGRLLATASDDDIVRLWDVESGTTLTALFHESEVTKILFSPNDEKLITTGSDGTARLWDVESGTELAVLRHEGWISSAVFNSDARRLITTNENGVRLWDANSGVELEVLCHGDGNPDVIFSPNGVLVATACGDSTARLHDAENGMELAVLQHEDRVSDIAFHPNGRQLATASADGTGRVWDVESGDQLAILRNEGEVREVIFSPNGQYLATDSVDGNLGAFRLWDVDSGAEVATLHHSNLVWIFGFTTSGRRLVIRDLSLHRTWLWNVENDTIQTVHSGQTSPFMHILRSDGRRLATVGDYIHRTVRLWDAETGVELATMRHEDRVTDVAFSPDGQRLATASEDGVVRVWRLEREDLLDLACSVLSRNFTLAEWQRYIGNEPYRETCPGKPVPDQDY